MTELDHEAMLDRILTSEFAKGWIKDREENLDQERDFYSHELSERQWKDNLVTNFFEDSWAEIYKVLPEIWPDIKERVKDALDWDVLEEPLKFEDHIYPRFGVEHVGVPFDLSEYLDDLELVLLKVLEKRFEQPPSS